MPPVALVTGGCGFIGAHLVQLLVQQNYTVRVLDNLSSGRAERLPPDVVLSVGDICDLEAVQHAVEGVELVFHLAALVSVQQSVEQPLTAYAVNATGTLHVLEAARRAGVRRVVQASTCAVYGDNTALPLSEREPPQPLSPYAASKLVAEQAGTLYAQLYGVPVLALRFFNVYGPGQEPNSPYAAAVPRFVAALRAGQQPTIYGDGEQTRDFVYVGDVAAALLATATSQATTGVFNVGRGEECSVLQLVHTLAELLGVAVQPHHAPARVGEVRRSCADVSVLQQTTGFRAPTTLRAGLRATLG